MPKARSNTAKPESEPEMPNAQPRAWLMTRAAARVISHARGWALGISGSDSGFAVFERAFGKMKAA